MAEIHLEIGATVALSKEALDEVLINLRQQGYENIGPKVRDGSVVYEPISSMQDLPRGYASEQDAGYYRLIPTGGEDYFSLTPGSHTWKQFFFPSRTELTAYQRDTLHPDRWNVESQRIRPPAYALIGVRPCELKAIQIQDRVFLRDDVKDPIYRSHRERAFILLVNCINPGGTCFCASIGTGPKAQEGFDLAVTELEDILLVEIGSETGRMVVANLAWEPASAFLVQMAQRRLEAARGQMVRQIKDLDLIGAKLLSDLDNPHYVDIASRCISCGNCTQVCPTCFCWDVQEINQLDGQVVRRERVWDSCFNSEYSYVFGGNSRPTTRSRYRQWITHKLASWMLQFGTLGCVGCGRCITWCPAKIDITVEAAALVKEK
jgi:sulfhydrogenase subunit beta (sulfur reductase)